MDGNFLVLGWTTLGLQVCGLWSLLVARFGRGRRATASARTVFLLSLVGLGVCCAACGAREAGSGLTAGITLAILLLGMSCGGAQDQPAARDWLVAPEGGRFERAEAIPLADACFVPANGA